MSLRRAMEGAWDTLQEQYLEFAPAVSEVLDLARACTAEDDLRERLDDLVDCAGAMVARRNGVVQAANGGAKVINLSLGSQGDSPFLHKVIQEVSKQKVAVFAAAGNEPVTTPFYPAAYPEVMAVTAVDKGKIASYANRGDFVSLGAPGNSVVCYNGQPYYVAGTSASSAFASGMAAGYMDNTQGSVDQMQTFIRGTFGLTPNEEQ